MFISGFKLPLEVKIDNFTLTSETDAIPLLANFDKFYNSDFNKPRGWNQRSLMAAVIVAFRPIKELTNLKERVNFLVDLVETYRSQLDLNADFFVKQYILEN